jgi:hypothetical protein
MRQQEQETVSETGQRSNHQRPAQDPYQDPPRLRWLAGRRQPARQRSYTIGENVALTAAALTAFLLNVLRFQIDRAEKARTAASLTVTEDGRCVTCGLWPPGGPARDDGDERTDHGPFIVDDGELPGDLPG